MGISMGIIFGLISMLGFGLGNGISQVSIKKIGTRRVIFFRSIFMSLILFIVLLFFLSETDFSPTYILITFVISLIGYIPLVTFYKALKIGKVGIISPIASSSVIFTILFSIIFFKESLSIAQLFSILLIMLGIILISINFKDIRNSHLFKTSSGVPFALITCVLWGLVFFLFKIPVNVLGPILTSFIVEFGNLIYSGTNLKISKIGFQLPDKRILTYIILLAICITVGTLFYNFGIRVSNVSIIAALYSSNPLVATLYGKFVYKEKLKIQQYFAILLILIGIVLISYF